MNYPLCVTAILLATILILYMRSKKTTEHFRENYWPSFHFPWFPWQRPYRQRPLPATGVITPGPQRCEDVCGYNTCRNYRSKLRAWRNCQRCKRQGLCVIDFNSGQCGKCASGRPDDCSQYGCQSADFRLGSTPPLDPSQTGCRLCPS